MKLQKTDSIEIPFKGGAYEGRSKSINAQRSINTFPVSDKNDAKVTEAMYGTPGYSEFSASGEAAICRGIHMMGDYLYAVMGDKIFRVSSVGTATQIDVMTTATGKIGMADNGTQVLIVDGSAAAYICTSSASTEIGATEDYIAAVDCVFFDGYFVTFIADGRIQISTLYNGLLWDALDVATAEAIPDGLIGGASTIRNIWLIGALSTEVYYNSGNADFPLERMPGAIEPVGCISGATIVEIKGVGYWLSDKGIVVRTKGYETEPVSPETLNYQFAQYTQTDALAWTYTLEGRSFYVINFPADNKTWVLNVEDGQWHEWRYNTDTMHKGVAAIDRGYLFNKAVIIGDRANGKLYTLDMDTTTDDGDLITRVRRTQVISKVRANVLFPRIELEFEAGTVTGDAEPKARLKWSDDGAETWSRERSVPIGSHKQFTTRSVWREGGKSRNRIFELTVAEDMKFVLIEAYSNLIACRA